MVYSYIFVKHVIEEICVCLGIYCLKLGPRAKED